MYHFRAIPTENKGHKLLAKMGWKEGEGLGRESGGIQQPVSGFSWASVTSWLHASENCFNYYLSHKSILTVITRRKFQKCLSSSVFVIYCYGDGHYGILHNCGCSVEASLCSPRCTAKDARCVILRMKFCLFVFVLFVAWK